VKVVTSDIAIIGAGIAGISAALFLAQKGASVVLLDKGPVGNEASGRNGGGVRQQNRDPAELPLAVEAVKIWADLPTRLGADLEYIRGGSCRLLESAKEKDAAEARIAREQAFGIPVELLTPDETIARLPMLAPDLKILGSTYCATDGTANPLLVMRAFARAVRRASVSVYPEEPVKCFEVKNGRLRAVRTEKGEYRADAFLLTAGPWAQELVRTIGLDFPVQCRRTQLMITEPLPPILEGFISFEDGYFRQAADGNFHLGVRGIPITAMDRRFCPVGLDHVGRFFPKVAPFLRDVQIIRGFAGITAWTPDAIPIIDAAPGVDGLYMAVGFSGHGFCLGPVVGKLLSEWIVDGQSSLDLSSFRWTRFL